MYNLRYHLASLVGVFLALALGLILGSVVAERGYLDEQQAALVDSLQADFDELRSANDQLRADFERDHGFASQVAGAFARDLLEGRTILVVSNEGRADGLADVNGAIIGAGGRVVTAMVAEPDLGVHDLETRRELTSVLTTDVPVAENEFRDVVVDSLIAELTAPLDETPVLEKLEDVGVVDFEGWDPAYPVDGVVVLTSFDGEVDPASIRLAARLRDSGRTALGADVSWSDGVIVGACLESGLSAVDSIDLPQGSLSAVMVLAGEAEGYFGLKDGAVGPYPQLISQGD